MTAPAVTAIVPTHNRPELMKRAVQSILSQDYDGPVEVIVVFDACDVELPDVPLGSGQSIRGMNNTRTRGLAGARNTGILAAGNPYVAFLDDDDHWLPGKLKLQLDMFSRHPDAVLVGTAMRIDTGDRVQDRLVPTEIVTYRHLLHNRLAGPHSSSFLFDKEKLLGSVGLVDEEVPKSYGEDYDLLLRTAAIASVAVVNRPLVNVTWQGQSLFVGQWKTYAEALQYLLGKHPAFSTSRKAIGRIESQIAFALASSGQRREAWNWSRRALIHDPRQPKAALALAIAGGLMTPSQVTRVAQRFNKGI